VAFTTLTNKDSYLFWKRCFDLALCIVGISVCFPLLLVIFLAIKIESPGPVFYRGLRTGLGGKPFRIWKFRTMVLNAEILGGGTTALNDFRIFRFGGLLRKYKVDELPQILNVMKGDMSLVGPRPELPQYTEQYKGDELLILNVRPGITDYSSIQFSSLQEEVGAEDADRVFEERILAKKNALRIRYVKERTFSGDVVLILRTFGCIIKKVF